MAEIRERLYQLDIAHPITNPNAHRMSFFNRNGLCVFRTHSPADSQLIQNAFELTDFEVVFNEGVARTRANRARAERRQLLTKFLDDDYRDFYFDDDFCDFVRHSVHRVLRFARDMQPVDHELLTIETILSSKAGSTSIQDPYVDKALLAFVAIHPYTTIILYPSSHRIHERLYEDYPPRRYALDLGDILIFHPRLIHCGDRYVETNIRLHYYIFAQPRIRWRNITFPIRDGELPLLQITRERM